MPEDGYTSVSVPDNDYAQADDYKPDAVTWGDVLVAGAERLNDHLDSDPPIPHDTSVEALAERIVDQIGADVGGPQVDDSEIARSVARELDYAHLADSVAEKVVSELEARR